jgi:ABC-2 type transport system ATP-binding protein
MISPPVTLSSQSKDEVVVEARGLVKRYEDLVAVDGVDLTVRRGECFGLLGPNGAGKTTTIEMLEGLTRSDAGSVTIMGETWARGRDHLIRQRLGIQLQDNQLAERLTVKEVLHLFRSFYTRGLDVEEALDLFELSAKRNARYHKLSGGQKQRLSLACALINNPSLIFLDEPTTGLDPQARNRVWELVDGFRSQGGTILLTTHYMEEAEKLCDRLAIMDNGRVILEGSPADLIAGLGANQVVEFRVANAAMDAEMDALPGVISATRRDGAFWLNVEAVETTLPALLANISDKGGTLEYLRTHQATLDDVFLEHTGRGLRDA